MSSVAISVRGKSVLLFSETHLEAAVSGLSADLLLSFWHEKVFLQFFALGKWKELHFRANRGRSNCSAISRSIKSESRSAIIDQFRSIETRASSINIAQYWGDWRIDGRLRSNSLAWSVATAKQRPVIVQVPMWRTGEVLLRFNRSTCNYPMHPTWAAEVHPFNAVAFLYFSFFF